MKFRKIETIKEQYYKLDRQILYGKSYWILYLRAFFIICAICSILWALRITFKDTESFTRYYPLIVALFFFGINGVIEKFMRYKAKKNYTLKYGENIELDKSRFLTDHDLYIIKVICLAEIIEKENLILYCNKELEKLANIYNNRYHRNIGKEYSFLGILAALALPVWNTIVTVSFNAESNKAIFYKSIFILIFFLGVLLWVLYQMVRQFSEISVNKYRELATMLEEIILNDLYKKAKPRLFIIKSGAKDFKYEYGNKDIKKRIIKMKTLSK
ncbi:hypothetical protein [Anaerosolibacter carboniphilus]|nr:hypothetical protein [Anaerosolibacter carboniphilus]